MAGGGAGREHEAALRFSNEPLADQFQREQRLADADGMDVHRAAGFVLERRGVNRRALAETRAETAAAQHFHDPTGKRREKSSGRSEPVEGEGGEKRIRARIMSGRNVVEDFSPVFDRV